MTEDQIAQIICECNEGSCMWRRNKDVKMISHCGDCRIAARLIHGIANGLPIEGEDLEMSITARQLCAGDDVITRPGEFDDDHR